MRHNGLASIDENIGKLYPLRIGINHPGDKEKVTGMFLEIFLKKKMRNLKNIKKI